MLQKLSERIHGVIAWVVILLIVITFMFFGVDYYMQSRQATNQNQVEVNNEVITKQALDLAYRRAKQSKNAKHMTTEQAQMLKQQVLNELIKNAISVQAAHHNGFEINLSQVNQEILKIPQFQQDGKFSSSRYRQALSNALFTPNNFQQEIKQGMLLNQQRYAFIGTSFSLEDEFKQFINFAWQARDVDYLVIPYSVFIDKNKIKQKEIEEYYQSHQKDFLSPEQIRIAYIHISLQDIKKHVQLKPAQIQRYYEDNKNNFYTPAAWKVSRIVFPVPEEADLSEQKIIEKNAQTTYALLNKDPKLFAEKRQEILKTANSKETINSDNFSEWMVAGQTSYDKDLVHLTYVGELSKLIKSNHGYEILQLLDYTPTHLKPLSVVKDEIQNQLIAEITEKKYTKLLDELSDLSYQTPDSLDSVSQAMHVPIEYSLPFSK